MSANTESNHGIFTGSEDNTYRPVIIKKKKNTKKLFYRIILCDRKQLQYKLLTFFPLFGTSKTEEA